ARAGHLPVVQRRVEFQRRRRRFRHESVGRLTQVFRLSRVGRVFEAHRFGILQARWASKTRSTLPKPTLDSGVIEIAEFAGLRLPVHLCWAVRGAMPGAPIEACRQGLKALLSDLRGDPQALETAYLSVITFSNSAQQVCPLTELMTFSEPSLTASGSTNMG